ncbi:hypothetical protein C672_1871 [[Clostridium] bifermentans ATCC 638]|uniref:Uncharacterized protein n=1 Tax=Paraclostridium bifermentans ATCC 638 = DSM 14991 TaxID=1233171 RepID=T4VQG2_PARBF|nr:hypothetical protein [Paraclostridium bifermentans]EQK42927.1 hypothetical protein C672_1871 [[Clostridium] bifermentans ATCC 638] [Paraclostridium bifermentans ATCC 638 = DSM 14991]RIZ58054.1 hypothetical protein CHH45_13480 [Paraclostridium bifermentans]UAG16810.1 hypothetical protein KXZ80_08395 [Paraclostridium bifermentans]
MKIDLILAQEYISNFRDEVTEIENAVDDLIEDYYLAEEEKDIRVEAFIISKMKEDGLEFELEDEDDEFIDF